MSQPLIAISVNQILRNGIDTNSISYSYTEAVVRAGGLPLLIPNDFPVNEIQTLCDRIDGVLLSGGGDIDVNLFDGEHHAKIGDPSRDRDRLEIALFQQALGEHLPIFGICRGAQLINVAMGGTLYTHIPTQFETTIEHNTPERKGRDHIAHQVEIEEGSLIGQIIGRTKIPVNSFHHQAIKILAPGLKVTARATDGLIEAVEIPGTLFKALGVQWHPEGIQGISEQRDLFSAFVTACHK
ncbi:MAG: gamma-glutamyl-gamma-aminobutyrate hydrolase family protein [Chloroflexi bacterium]|nr:gamma-glutamyl-gamma-aminobutyrate hydrolase family protein [Chloroflexota bacterium]